MLAEPVGGHTMSARANPPAFDVFSFVPRPRPRPIWNTPTRTTKQRKGGNAETLAAHYERDCEDLMYSDENSGTYHMREDGLSPDPMSPDSYTRSDDTVVTKPESPETKTLASRLRDAYRDPMSNMIPLGLSSGKSEYEHLGAAGTTKDENPGAPLAVPESHEPARPSPKIKKIKKVSFVVGTGKQAGNISRGNLAKKTKKTEKGTTVRRRLVSPSPQKPKVQARKAGTQTPCPQKSPTSASNKPNSGHLPAKKPKLLKKKSAKDKNTNVVTPTTETQMVTRGRSRVREHAAGKRTPLTLSRVLGSAALGLVLKPILQEKEVVPTGPAVIPPITKEPVATVTQEKNRRKARKRVRDYGPAHPPPLKVSKIIGPRDLIYNESLGKIKMESDYIPPERVKEEPMDDGYIRDAEGTSPFAVGGGGIPVNMGQLILVKQEVEDSALCFGDLVQGNDGSSSTTKPSVQLVHEEDLTWIKLERAGDANVAGNTSAAEADLSLESLNI